MNIKHSYECQKYLYDDLCPRPSFVMKIFKSTKHIHSPSQDVSLSICLRPHPNLQVCGEQLPIRLVLVLDPGVVRDGHQLLHEGYGEGDGGNET